jgi:3-oxoacyl-[acyl-carrier protein] reductase
MIDLLDFSGKTVLVVGGSSGIGNAVAQTFRSRGASVFVWGTRERATDYTDTVGSDLAGLSYDQVDLECPDAVADYRPAFSSLDLLVLSQGIVLYKRAEFEMQAFRRVMEINLNSVMACAVKFQPMLSQSTGSLIVVNSTAAFEATRGNPAYSASKSGLLGLTATLAQAWAPTGVRVNGIAPGMVETKLTRVTTDVPERRAEFLNRIPLKRFASCLDVAHTALFLASPLASYITGQTIVVDGGLLL